MSPTSTVSERVLAAAMDQAPVAMALYEPSGRCVYHNASLARMAVGAGASLKESFRGIASWSGDGLVSAAERALEEGRRAHCEVRLGDDSWYLCTFDRLEADGVALLALTIASVARQTEAVVESRESFRHLVEALDAGVVFHAADTSIISCNAAACHILGLTEEQLRGKQATDPRWKFVHEDGSPMPLEEFPVNRVVATEQRLVGHVVGVVRPDRDYTTWVLCNAFPIHGDKGELDAVTVAFIEVTDKLRAQRERRLADAQLAQADRLSSMGLLAAGVAHEINNPLTYLMHNLETLCTDLPVLTGGVEASAREELIARATEAWEGSRRIRDIATGLSSFARVDESALQLVDLRQPLEAAAAMAANEIRFRARIVKDYEATPLVLASEGQLSQVFLNLLINAAHALDKSDEDDHQISLRVFSEGDQSCVEIRDTGTGIPPERLARLFEPFHTTKPVGRGSGLGLTISRNIVESYDGQISVTSTLGEGTTVQVRLPASETTHWVERRVTGATGGEMGPLRILVVDDEPMVRNSVVRLLRGHETVALGGGAEAIELLTKDNEFDLILCDMMMPGTTGMQVHAWLDECEPGLAQKFVFVTGGAFTQAASDYLARVQVPRLSKPFDAAEFWQQVSPLLSTQ